MTAAKRVLRYIKGILSYEILFSRSPNNAEVEVLGFTDCDWSGDAEDRKSTSGYIFMIGSALVSWCSNKQNFVALSSCEAEHVAVAH